MRSRVWTVQPPPGTPIDWDSPLAQGLVDVIDMHGFPRSMLLGTPATLFGTSQQFGQPTSQGVAFDTNASYAGVYFERADAAYAPLSQSHVFVGQFNAYSGQYAGLICSADQAGSTSRATLQFDSASTFYFFVDTTTAYTATVAIPVGKQLVLSASVSPSEAASVYLNGAFAATFSGATTRGSLSGSRLVVFGERTASPSYASEGLCAAHLFYRRTLSATEHAAIGRNPWQIFHRRQRFYSIATSTGAVFTASPTMPDAIVAGQAALRIAASAAPTVPAGIAQASAALAITGSVAIAVPDGIVTAALSSGAVLTAALTAQRGIPQSSASLSIAATGAPTAPSAFSTASAALSIALTGNATVPAGMARANAGTGSVFSVAVVAQTGAISATGALSIAATGTITVAAPAVSARGALSIAGAVETAIPDAEARAAASTASGSVLSAALRVPTASPVIQAQLVVSANIAITVPDALVTAAGIIGSTPNPCMMVYLPTRDFTITIPARAFTATLPTRKFTVTLKC